MVLLVFLIPLPLLVFAVLFAALILPHHVQVGLYSRRHIGLCATQVVNRCMLMARCIHAKGNYVHKHAQAHRPEEEQASKSKQQP